MRTPPFPVVTFTVLIVLTILLFFFWNSWVFSPVRTLVSWVTVPASSIFFSSSGSAGRSQNSLQEESSKRTKQLVDQRKLQLEVKALRDQFQTQKPQSQSLLPARIIGEPRFIPGVSKPSYLVIDRGSRDDVTRGLPVVYRDNLVGHVQGVSETFSTVQLATDPAFSVTAKSLSALPKKDPKDLTQDTGAVLGVVRGMGDGLLLDNVVLSETLKKGDVIATFGNVDKTGRGFLPDIVVGTIVSVDKKPSALFQKATLQPLVDPTKLTTVFVVMPKK